MPFNYDNLGSTYEEHVTDVLLADIVGFSKLTNVQQHVAVQILSDALRNAIGLLSNQSFLKQKEWILDIIPTGDGFYVLLDHKIAGYGPLLALSLRSIFQQQVHNRSRGLVAGVRLAVHMGPVIPFADATDQRNWAGDGLNDCARYLSSKRVRRKGERLAGGSSFIVVSEDAWNQFRKAYPIDRQETREFFEAIGIRNVGEVTFRDKHCRKHHGIFLEGSRHMVMKPPPPADLWQRMQRVAEEAVGKGNPREKGNAGDQG